MIPRTVSFAVQGPPVPKGRPRFVVQRAGGPVHTYTPKRTAAYEREVGEAWVTANAPEPRPAQFSGPVCLTVFVWEGGGHPADLDNYVKVVGDALNGLAWADDVQVERLHAEIRERGSKSPALSVVVSEIEKSGDRGGLPDEKDDDR